MNAHRGVLRERTVTPMGWVAIVLAVLIPALVAGCGSVPPDEPAATTSVQISIDFATGGSSGLRFSLPAGLGAGVLAATVNDVASVTVDVYQGATPITTGVALAKDTISGVWSGTISGLPLGVQLTFTAHAFDATLTEIFSGSTNITLNGSGDPITIAMAPMPSPALTLPRIVSIQVPSQVAVNSSASVSFELEGNSAETLDWTLATGGGTFAPNSGFYVLAPSGTGTLTVTYTAPSATGTYTHTVRVTNSQNNSVEATFSILVSGATGNVVLQFGPVVTSILGSRQANTVTWTATVVDDGPTLGYAWSAAVTGGATPGFRIPANTNPAFLDGYDQTVAGTVTLAVTDSDGLITIVTIGLPAGQFPDNLVVTSSQGLNYVDGDDKPEMTAVPWLTPSPFGPGQTVTLSVPVDSDVGYLMACVIAQFADAIDLFNMVDRGCTNQWSRTPALGTATQTLQVDGVLPASNEYWILVVACSNLANCEGAFTGTVYTSNAGASTYSKQDWVLAVPMSSAETGVPIPTFSSPGGSLGIQYVNGDGMAEMTSVPQLGSLIVSADTDTFIMIDVPVDSDTGSVCIEIGNEYNLGSGFPTGSEGSGCASVTPGAPQVVSVTVNFLGLTLGPHSLTVSVGLAIPGPDNTNTSWNYASTNNPGMFRVVKYPGNPVGVEQETGVTIPLFTVVP